MPKYRIEGRVYDVPTPESAYALHENWKSGGEVTGVTGESALSNTLAGIGSGMVNVGRQVGNMLGLVDDEEIAKQAEMDKALLDTTAGKVGRFGGEVAATLPLGMGAGQAARGIGVLGQRVLPAAVEAATEGAILAGPGERAGGALLGGGIGGGLGAASAMAGRAARGVKGITPEARRLMDEGVQLTPGQAAGGGMVKAMEESAGARLMPGVKEARQMGLDDTVRVMMKRAAPSRSAREAIDMGKGNLSDDLDRLYQSFEPIYGQVKGYPAKFVTPNGQDLGSAMLSTAMNAPADDMVRQRVGRFVEKELSGLTNRAKGQLKTDDLLEVRSRLREQIRKLQKANGDTYEIDAFEAVEDLLSDAIESQLDTVGKGLLRRADRQYAKYKTVEDVVAARGDMPMTRNALVKGVERAETRMAGRGGMARGSDYTGMRDIAQAASKVLDEGTPKTGMSLAMPLLTGTIGASIGGPAGAALGAAGAGLVPSAAAVFSPVRRAMLGSTQGQRALQKTLDQIRKPLEYGGALTRAGATTFASEE